MNSFADFIRTNITDNVRVISNTCFIPTISALDINVELSESFDPQNSKCKTIFDHIHANTTDNRDHFSLTQDAKNFIMTHLFANEKPVSRFYDAMNITIPNKTVVSGEVYNRTASYAITNASSFVVESGGYSNLTAGHTIAFNPGFRVESGGIFSAKIVSNASWCPSPVEFKPHHILSSTPPKSGSSPEDTIIVYDCSNYTEMPDYDPSYAYFDCGDSSVNMINEEEITPEFIDSLLTENIHISVVGRTMTIEFSSEIDLENVTVRVYDSIDIRYASHGIALSNRLSINLPSTISGPLTVTVEFNNEYYHIHTRHL